MTQCDLPPSAGETSIPRGNRYDHLLLVDLNIDPDGTSAEVGVLLSDEISFVANVPHWELDAMISQLQYAADEMRRRQRMHVSGPSNSLRDTCEHALEPMKTDIFVDPRSGAVVFLHRFEHHAPLAIRMSPDKLKILRAKTNSALARLAN